MFFSGYFNWVLSTGKYLCKPMEELLLRDGEKIQIAIFFMLFFVGWNLENFISSGLDYKKWKHAFTNMPFIFTSLPAELILSVLFVKAIAWTQLHHFGIIYLFPLEGHPVLLFVVSFLLLDLGEYIYHVVAHKVRPLWSFHAVHHSDKVMDISTTLREHPGDNLKNAADIALGILSGSLFWVLILRQIIQLFFSLFSHLNFRLPENRPYCKFAFNTPNFHHVHHHHKLPLQIATMEMF
jgi:sterol desaturase/sphingolipid hydroxylase (fatty acid hydroxylase superfamily)